jgi:HlyD family secretion protein
MKKSRTLFAVAVATLCAAGLAAWWYQRADATALPAYRFTTIERGDVRATVSATGALGAVQTVQVGTQVSGQVSAIFVDFNAKVRKGQLLATIDPTLQRQAVEEAQAGLDRAQAQSDLAQQDYDRNKQLFDAKMVTNAEFGTISANHAVALANVKSARVALSRARQNLAYTNIYSPIDGIIVERNVDVGQTVAASLTAPQLFLIANDLSHMQILASVDESDIGAVKDGQDVRFTVQSYANRQFTGRVSQVRLQSTTTDNVVNYTVVVSVDNASGALRPGMTATLQFTTGSATNVLTVPSAALRFSPSQEALGDARVTAPRGPKLWSLDVAGKLVATQVKVDLTDGSRTVVEGAALEEGVQVILAASVSPTKSATTSQSTSTNPLQPQGPPGGRGGGPPRS